MFSRLPSWLVMKFSQGENTARAGGPPQGEGRPGLSGVNSPSLNAGRCLASGAERTLSIFRVAPRWCFRERGRGRPTPAVNPRVFLQAFTRKPATCAWQACALYPPKLTGLHRACAGRPLRAPPGTALPTRVPCERCLSRHSPQVSSAPAVCWGSQHCLVRPPIPPAVFSGSEGAACSWPPAQHPGIHF